MLTKSIVIIGSRVMLLLLVAVVGATALVCPPFCIGANRTSVFLASRQEVALLGRVVGGVQTGTGGGKRVTGVGGEVDHLVAVSAVFRGGVFLKRVGKNALHVFAGLGLEPGSECSVSLATNEVYLLAGSARRGTSLLQTALIDVNQCGLSVPWSTVSENERAWLTQMLQARSDGRCPVATSVSSSAPVCGCAAGFVCSTNAMPTAGSYCGPAPRSWCIPAAESTP